MTWNQRRNWDKFCSEPIDKIEHYEEALAEDFAGWCIHHRLEIQESKRVSRQELKDQGLYYDRPANELVFMTNGEHMKLHMTGKHHSEEHRQKIAESLKCKHRSAEHRKKLSEALSGEKNPMYGKHHSEESRKKIAEAKRGKLWWNNGVSCKHAKECPGPEWKLGRL